jgi:S1-C subfamily serine protease
MDETQSTPDEHGEEGVATTPPAWPAPGAAAPGSPPAPGTVGGSDPMAPPPPYGPAPFVPGPTAGPEAGAPGSGGWQGGWAPPPAPPSAGTPWSPGPTSDPFWTPQPPRRHSISVAVTALLVAVAVVAGVGIGASLPHSTYTAASAGPGTGGAGSGSGGATAPGSLFPSFGGTGGGTGTGGGSSGTGSGTPAAGTGPSDVSAIAAKVDPGLVDIKTDLSYQGEEAAGTGIVLNSTGLVLTNNHVINGSTKIEVTDIGNKRTYGATVVGYDESADVALVQLQGATGLKTASLGNSSSADVGQDVVAIGNAGGVGGTPSAVGGTIIALDQSITASDEGTGTSEKLTGLIKTNADVQPGDSGGSLVTTGGIVVGMDTAAASGFSFNGSATEGFAIPINTALGLAHEIADHDATSSIHVGATAFLGVAFTAAAAGGSDTAVGKVIPGTAAERAGLAAGDVITSFGGHAVGSPGDLTRLLVSHHPGDTVSIGWRTAAGTTVQRTVTLGSGPNA